MTGQCAGYVCDLHENARRYYRSIKPEGPNELARLNLFEQVTRRLVSARNMPARSPDRARVKYGGVAVFGQIVQAAGRIVPLAGAKMLRPVGGRHEPSVFFVTAFG